MLSQTPRAYALRSPLTVPTVWEWLGWLDGLEPVLDGQLGQLAVLGLTLLSRHATHQTIPNWRFLWTLAARDGVGRASLFRRLIMARSYARAPKRCPYHSTDAWVLHVGRPGRWFIGCARRYSDSMHHHNVSRRARDSDTTRTLACTALHHSSRSIFHSLTCGSQSVL